MIKLSIFITFVTLSLALDPAIKLAFQPELFNNAKNYLLPGVIAKTEALKIPDVNDETKFGIIGVNIKMFNMQITNLKLDIPATGLIHDDKTITITLKDLSLVFVGNFNIKAALIFNPEGVLTATLKKTDLVIPIGYENVNGELKLSAKDIGIVLDFDYEIKGSFTAEIIQFFTKWFKSKIVSTVESKVKEALTAAINVELEGMLEHKPKVIKTKTGVNVNVEILTSSFLNDVIELEMTGFSYIDDKDIPNYPIQTTLPTLGNVDPNEVDAVITAHFLNAMAYGFMKSGTLGGVITNADIPVNQNIELTTKAFSPIFEGINSLYPDSDIQLHCSAKDPIDLAFANDNIQFTAGVDCDFVAELGQGKLSQFATLKLQAAGDLQLIVKDFTIYPQVSSMTITNVTKVNSKTDVDTEGFKVLANVGAGLSIEAINRRILAKGFALPAWDGITFKKADLKFQDGFLLLKVEPQFGSAKMEFLNRIILKTISSIQPSKIIEEVCLQSTFEFLAKRK